MSRTESDDPVAKADVPKSLTQNRQNIPRSSWQNVPRYSTQNDKSKMD
jgi:hypothetical protein